MKKLILVGLLFVAGCASPVPSKMDFSGNIAFYHDDMHKVSCWYIVGYQSRALSCLPDSQVKNSGE